MARPPLILVTPSIEKRGVEFHDLSASLSVKYDFAVTQAGGIPVAAPTTADCRLLAEVVRRMDGVLLTGGDDINPDLYTKNLPRAVRKTIEQTPDGGGRDLRELVLIHEVFRQRKPLLAICRGHQLLNIALGGTTVPGGKPVIAVPGLSPTFPVMTLGPVLVIAEPPRTAKLARF